MIKEFIYQPPTKPYLEVLYEDKDIMVVNKPSGLLSVPGKKIEYQDSILYRVRQKYADAQAVHRLDMGTSGIMVVGLSKTAISNLGKQFMQRQTQKVYLAKVAGCLEQDSGIINLPMRTDINNRPYQIIDFEHGREAITYYEKVIVNKLQDFSIVRLYPKTGRSHQLRLHLQQIGHPILGDHLYADEKNFLRSKNLCLHAAALSFYHPISNEKMQFCSDVDFLTELNLKVDINILDKDIPNI